MSLAMHAQKRDLRKKDYQKIVSFSFLHPNLKVNIFSKPDKLGVIIVRIGDGNLAIKHFHQTNSSSLILYFHGGAFTVPMNTDQFNMIENVAQQSESDLYIADFPLIPAHSGQELLNFSEEAFKQASSTGQKVFLLADSAGATLAIHLAEKYRNQISGLILASPWIVSETQPANSTKEDLMLDPAVLNQIRDQFLVGLSDGDSFSFLDSEKLNNLKVLLIYGSEEILADTDQKLISALDNAADTEVLIDEVKGAFHDFILWNKLPETKKAIKKIADFIKYQRGV